MLSGIAHVEQNELAQVTCHSEATLLGHLCFKTCSYLRIFSPPDAKPFHSWSLSPGSGPGLLQPLLAWLIVQVSPVGIFQICFLAGEGDLANRNQPTDLRPAVSEEVKSD